MWPNVNEMGWDGAFEFTFSLTMEQFNQEFLDNCTDNTNYSGVFQTEKYFANADKELREDLTFKKESSIWGIYLST